MLADGSDLKKVSVIQVPLNTEENVLKQPRRRGPVRGEEEQEEEQEEKFQVSQFYFSFTV